MKPMLEAAHEWLLSKSVTVVTLLVLHRNLARIVGVVQARLRGLDGRAAPSSSSCGRK